MPRIQPPQPYYNSQETSKILNYATPSFSYIWSFELYSAAFQLARDRPHGWRSGYKPPSKSYFRRNFECFTAPFTLTSMFLTTTFWCPHLAEKKLSSVTRCCILAPPINLNFLMVATLNVIYDLRKPQIKDAIFIPYLNRLPDNRHLSIDNISTHPGSSGHHMTLWHRITTMENQYRSKTIQWHYDIRLFLTNLSTTTSTHH